MDDALSLKRAIRERLLRERADMSARDRERTSAAVCESIGRIEAFRSAGSILFYMPMRGEVDISPLLISAIARGVCCALPRCAEGRSLRFFQVGDPALDVEPGFRGIPEPKECLNELDGNDFSVIMVPGAAFDRRGWRIGYGAGYYDRLLSAAGRKALKIAPAYGIQVLDSVPHFDHDVQVDIIVTEEEIIDCRGAGGENNGEKAGIVRA